jgi:signal transduction histidine kinase
LTKLDLLRANAHLSIWLQRTDAERERVTRELREAMARLDESDAEVREYAEEVKCLDKTLESIRVAVSLLASAAPIRIQIEGLLDAAKDSK